MLALVLGSASVVEAGDFETLAQWMTGSFSSADQAEADERYYDIRLEMVPIWTERRRAPRHRHGGTAGIRSGAGGPRDGLTGGAETGTSHCECACRRSASRAATNSCPALE